MKKISIILIISLLIPSISIATDSLYVWSENSTTLETANIDNTNGEALTLESESAILIEQSTGKIIFEKNSHEILRPASVTKVMTILLIAEAIDNGEIKLTDTVSCSEKASSMGGSQIWLDEKDNLTIQEMLKAICVVSANDCSVAMAEHLGGTEEGFVAKMNERAKELGMYDTTFKNCHGIDEDGHVTSSYDIALMSKELLQNHPWITEYTTIWMDSLRNGESELVNTNKLLRNYKGATGLKTGSTSLALYNLSASATRDGLNLIAVIMRAPTTKLRFNEAKQLLDYGFANYKFVEKNKAGDVITNTEVIKGVEKNVNLLLENDTGFVVKKGDEKNVEEVIEINENIEAPIAKGDVLGKVSYVIEGTEVASSNLIAEKDIEKLGFWNISGYIFKTWSRLFK